MHRRLQEPFPDVVSTFGAHLVTRPSSPEGGSATPVDANSLRLLLESALTCHEIRIKKYGRDIADNWRYSYTPVEARQRYYEAHLKAIAEIDKLIQEEQEEVEEEERRRALEAHEKVAREEVVDNTATSMLHSLPTPKDDADTVCEDKHPQQLPQATEALDQTPTATVASPLSPQSQPSKRRRLTPEDEDTRNCTKCQHLPPEMAAENALESEGMLEKADNSTEKNEACRKYKKRRIAENIGVC